MSHRVLKWDESSLDAAGGIDVPIYPPPDFVWLDAFEVAHQARRDEVRSQVYERANIQNSCLVLEGVPAEALAPTQAFFDMIAQKANGDAARLIAQREAVSSKDCL
jgi:hypothetical protein